MASFRDAFTKEKKEALNYDDNAALYFTATLLVLVVVPWSISLVRKLLFPLKSSCAQTLLAVNSRSSMKSCICSACSASLRQKREKATCFRTRLRREHLLAQLVAFAAVCFLLYAVIHKLSTVSEINAFEPYEILNVTKNADIKTVRKAYRRMSLIHHPDRHPNDPLASARFILISKAYNALSDETARRNYDKYGNPDGPDILEVGIGLPQFLVAEENQTFFLSLFTLIVIVGIPFAFILYYQKQKIFYPNGVRVETIQFLGVYMTEATNFKRAIELFAASAESRDMTLRDSDKPSLDAITAKLTDLPKKSQFPSPVVPRNTLLLLAHMHRLWEFLTLELREDLNVLLSLALSVTQSMIEIAFLRNWYPVIRSILELRRCLIQAMMPTTPALLQAPHYASLPSGFKKQYNHRLRLLADDLAASQSNGACPIDVEERLSVLAELDPVHRADVETFCACLPRLKLEVDAFVHGEEQIVQGDVVTIRVTVTRLNLPTNATAGPVHAPYFCDLKFEEWWLFVIYEKTGGLLSFCRATSPDAQFVEELRFALPHNGNCHYKLVAMCDAYEGLDVVGDIRIKVLSPSEAAAAREITVHPDDAALDDAPSILQQVLGQENEEASSDED